MTAHRVFFALLIAIFASTAVAQGTVMPFGQVATDPDAPVEVTAETLDVDQAEGSALFEGDVVVGQGEMRMSSDKLLVFYNEAGDAIERMEATGNVVLVSGPDAAESDWAEYTIPSGVVVMRGQVLVTQGATAVSSDTMTVNLNDGTARMVGRVKTVLQQGSDQ